MRFILHPASQMVLAIGLAVAIGLGGVRAGGGSGDDHHGNFQRDMALASTARGPAALPTAVPGGPGFLMLAASDFAPDTNQDAFFRYWGGNFIQPAEGSSGIGISAPVHLPHGAQITKLTAFYYDSDPGSAPLLDLYRGITDTLELIGDLSSSLPAASFAEGEDVRSAEITGGAALVDNSRYSYMLIATLNRDPVTPSHTQRLHSVRVDYAFPVALPVVTR